MSDEKINPYTQAGFDEAAQLLSAVSMAAQQQIQMMIGMYANRLGSPRPIYATCAESAIYQLVGHEELVHRFAVAAEGETVDTVVAQVDHDRALFFALVATYGMLNQTEKRDFPHPEWRHPMTDAADALGKIIAPRELPDWIMGIRRQSEAEIETFRASQNMGEAAGRA